MTIKTSELKQFTKSLEEVNSSVPVLKDAKWFRKALAFLGPGFMISVGYMDPGNWATDLAGGSAFGYKLLFVVLLSNIMAMILQHLSLKLGIVTSQDLAQACGTQFRGWFKYLLWLLAEVAITACDLAEVIGSAIALELLFGLPVVWGVLLTSLDVFVLLFLHHKGQRILELFIICLVAIVFGSFAIELFLAKPPILSILGGMAPSPEILSNQSMLYVAIGILGATVMPHNLYLHSALVQSRAIGKKKSDKKEAIKYATWDSNFALITASMVNAAILILAASVFHANGVGVIAEIQDAYKLLTPLLGTAIASVLFAVALLASGHSSTITGTLAGQVVMEGFVSWRIPAWQRRLITRLLAIVPALFIVLIWGKHGLASLLVFSQVVLSLQLPFAVIPLVMMTSNPKKMGTFVNSKALIIISSIIATVITLLNGLLIWQFVTGIINE